jgi:hypothetical protein
VPIDRFQTMSIRGDSACHGLSDRGMRVVEKAGRAPRETWVAVNISMKPVA